MVNLRVGSHEHEVWELLVKAKVFRRGDFTFASGQKATLKVDMEKIYESNREYRRLLTLFSIHPVVVRSDVLIYVPNGMKRFCHDLSKLINKPVADVVKTANSTNKYDFSFSSSSSRLLAIGAQSPLICEDVVTTLGSVAGVRAILMDTQKVSSLAILLRGKVLEEYKRDIDDYYLLTKYIPYDADGFHNLFGDITA